ncbi:YjgB family protein [Alicyclobacillus ferrooxydans]|uniref:YjgB family protein n=1 Tax=Alicyclobacillus ferrooxydans TaxID=471514 RepID=UPI0006D557C9|nr:YjgB family protein [Alicyclobacillus ferrooxydans]
MRRTVVALSAVALFSSVLVGCSTPGHQGTTTSPSTNGRANQAAGKTNEQGTNAAGSANAAGTGTNNTGQGQNGSASSANTSPSNTAASNTAGTNSNPGQNNTGSSPTSSVQASAEVLVKQSMHLATLGADPNIPFSLQENMSVVESAWGKPDSENGAGAGIYASYNSHQTALGFNKGGQLIDLRSYGSNIQSITLADIKAVLGTPGEVRESSDSIIYMYPAGPDYQLLWVFPKTSSGGAGPTVNHISVFLPAGTIDLMAQNQPAPSVVVDNAPGTVGSLFTFSIMHAPTGYRLVELEWLPAGKPPVVNTFNQALQNGKLANLNPGFSISGDGQTLSFLYPSSMHSESGHVQVIFQAVSGSALIGTSPIITLK